ncbi:MAG: DUF423 domain-containing protein [Cyclobacteriaceae bacterium]|nr:DUF423 domain-containing protein [Cyclobacteriaceae bacterium]
MNYKNTIAAAGIMGLLAVALGAFGAHALKPTLLANNRLSIYELAVQYQFYHTFALLAIALLMRNKESRHLQVASVFMFMGIVCFSGSLYILALTNTGWLGVVTPLGGVCFLVGWGCLVINALRH